MAVNALTASRIDLENAVVSKRDGSNGAILPGGHVVSECDDVESQGKESVVLAFIEKPQQAAADELRAVWKKRVLVEVAWAGRAVKVVSMLLL